MKKGLGIGVMLVAWGFLFGDIGVAAISPAERWSGK